MRGSYNKGDDKCNRFEKEGEEEVFFIFFPFLLPSRKRRESKKEENKKGPPSSFPPIQSGQLVKSCISSTINRLSKYG